MPVACLLHSRCFLIYLMALSDCPEHSFHMPSANRQVNLGTARFSRSIPIPVNRTYCLPTIVQNVELTLAPRPATSHASSVALRRASRSGAQSHRVMPPRYSLEQPTRCDSNLHISIVGQDHLKAMFQPPLRPRMLDRTSSLQSALNWPVAEQYQPGFSHGIMESSSEFLEELNEQKAQDKILKEIADWLDLDECDWQQALRQRRIQRVGFIYCIKYHDSVD